MHLVDYTNFRYHSMWHISNDGSHLVLQIIRHVMVDTAVLNKRIYARQIIHDILDYDQCSQYKYPMTQTVDGDIYTI